MRKLFTSLEFRTLHERLKELKLQRSQRRADARPRSRCRRFHSEADLRRGAKPWRSPGMKIGWLSAIGPGDGAPVASCRGQREAGWVSQRSEPAQIAHDAKVLCRSPLVRGIEIQGLYCDTKIAAYLLEPGAAGGYTVRDTVGRYLGASIDAEKAEAQAGEQAMLAFGTDEKRRVAREAVALRALAPVLEEQLRTQGSLGACNHLGISAR